MQPDQHLTQKITFRQISGSACSLPGCHILVASKPCSLVKEQSKLRSFPQIFKSFLFLSFPFVVQLSPTWEGRSYQVFESRQEHFQCFFITVFTCRYRLPVEPVRQPSLVTPNLSVRGDWSTSMRLACLFDRYSRRRRGNVTASVRINQATWQTFRRFSPESHAASGSKSQDPLELVRVPLI